MATNFFSATDALQVWDNVKDSVKASIAITRSRDANSLDYSFITPTLLGQHQSIHYVVAAVINMKVLMILVSLLLILFVYSIG